MRTSVSCCRRNAGQGTAEPLAKCNVSGIVSFWAQSLFFAHQQFDQQVRKTFFFLAF